MKFLVKESSAHSVEQYRKVFFKLWDKKGPKIDEDILKLLGFKYGQAEGGRVRMSHVYNFLIEYLGESKAVSLTKELLLKNPHKITPKGLSGYDFEFNVSKIIEIDRYGVSVNVLVDDITGKVTLTMTGGETLYLKTALKNEDFGWEIENEIGETIYDYFVENITYKTGITVVTNKLILLSQVDGK